jgi:hypothetical protein
VEGTTAAGQHHAAPDGEQSPQGNPGGHDCGPSAGSSMPGRLGAGGGGSGVDGGGGSGIAAPGIRGSGTDGAGPGTSESPFSPVYAEMAGGISGGPGFGPAPPGARRASLYSTLAGSTAF